MSLPCGELPTRFLGCKGYAFHFHKMSVSKLDASAARAADVSATTSDDRGSGGEVVSDEMQPAASAPVGIEYALHRNRTPGVIASAGRPRAVSAVVS
jgi:hypothetical protein